MILDNKISEKKVYEWINEYTEKGKMDIVTGYFTVGALSYLSKKINQNISSFRLLLGDIVSIDKVQDRTIDLINENITIEVALKICSVAKEAVRFLKQEKVEAKTLEPNFCHAKTFIYKNNENDAMKNYVITGSSNLTEAGIGLKTTNNIELNVVNSGTSSDYKELLLWFDNVWNSKEAHKTKTILHDDGKKTTTNFKEYLINAIEKLFIEYTPKQLYYKVLFELFGSQILSEYDNPEFNRQVGRLENTVIYQTLYDFQKKGVLSLIKMLQKYDGAILADAVGLGKTWSALAVIKFFQLQGREVILICPKKLQYNWHRYKKHQNSRFEKDQFDYFMRYHTDMQMERMERYNDRSDKLFVDEKPKLFVIDESHNLRNSKSQRYRFFVDEILSKNTDVKVLMLSATPINNTLIDIKNQFKLIKQGKTGGFFESHSIRNIDHIFSKAQKIFFDWKDSKKPKINDFIKLLPSDFFKLTDSLIVARTRLMIEKQNTGLFFPKKSKPENIFVTPKKIGNYDSFEELVDHFPPFLSGYQPSFYVEQAEDVLKIHDERQRDRFLVQMMYILLVKRLESSWFSFKSTVEKILANHQNALNKVNEYEIMKKDMDLSGVFGNDLFADDDEDDELSDDFSLGKKRPIRISDIDKSGNLKKFKVDIKKDIEALDALKTNLVRFAEDIKDETKKYCNSYSKDEKLESLIGKIKEKQKTGKNGNNQKVLIFTVYKDTAFYLFDQMVKRGFENIAVVTGGVSKTDTYTHETKLFEPILERFAPFTKLFNEKEWSFTPSKSNLPKKKQYIEWIDWVQKNDLNTFKALQNPIDILISTDVLSEGQNLQDCDMVINYDIHWNPVRVIQRMGRIDRLGSPNNEIFCVNYWPSENINTYLNLKGRIEKRMAIMKLAGSEVQLEFSDSFREMATDSGFEDKMNERMLKQMQTKWEDIEVNENGLGFDNLSLEGFRQDLLEEIQRNEKFYENMPKGVYTGFEDKMNESKGEGIIALLGFPSKPPGVVEHEYNIYDLVYIDKQGNQILLNQKEVLDVLALKKNAERFVPDLVEKGDPVAIEELSKALKNWMKFQATDEEILEDGTVKNRVGAETKNLLEKLKSGDSSAVRRIKENISVSEKYQVKNFDLIAWFLVS
ncbi:MAG: DEAD/DEAH box helicase family protein [Caldisericia bacterium]|nr:DEAD/DEAH box helicase family protein [Caldisericia bacterium]